MMSKVPLQSSQKNVIFWEQQSLAALKKVQFSKSDCRWDDIHWWSDSAFNQSQKVYKYVIFFHYHHNIHFETTPSSRLSTDVDEQLTDATSMHTLEDTLHVDWFHRFWWSKWTLTQIQASDQCNISHDDEPLAKSMTFIVWRLFTSLQIPYAQFPCASISGVLLLSPSEKQCAIWKDVASK